MIENEDEIIGRGGGGSVLIYFSLLINQKQNKKMNTHTKLEAHLIILKFLFFLSFFFLFSLI